MELFGLVLALIMLFIFGYAHFKKDTIKIPGNLTSHQDDEFHR